MFRYQLFDGFYLNYDFVAADKIRLIGLLDWNR